MNKKFNLEEFLIDKDRYYQNGGMVDLLPIIVLIAGALLLAYVSKSLPIGAEGKFLKDLIVSFAMCYVFHHTLYFSKRAALILLAVNVFQDIAKLLFGIFW